MKWLALLVCLSSSVFGTDYCADLGKKPGVQYTADPTLPSDIAKDVRAIFERSCTVCHGVGNTRGPIRDILDTQHLKDIGILNLKDPEQSRLNKAVTRTTRRMPLGEDSLPQDEIDLLLEWQRQGAPGGTVTDGGEFVTYEQEVTCIAQDVGSLKRHEAQYFRYASLATVFNANRPGKFKSAGWALDKALNQISFNPHLTPTKKVDPLGIIRRIDLRSYNLYAKDWDTVILERYPYAIAYFDPTYINAEERFIEKVTYSPRAYVRGDWLIQEVMQPPLYYDLLHLPKTLYELEYKLGLDTNLAVKNYEVDRAAIRSSGVSLWNRLIDRYDLSYWVQGVKIDTSYWKTFDVAHEVKERNYFAFPFGPVGVAYLFTTVKFFAFDAGEMIFGLPNGLQAYYVADAKGKRLDEAVTTIAVDRANIHPYIGSAPGVVRTGVSCNHCHAGGINPFQDQLRYHVEHTSGFSKVEYDAIRQLVKDQTHMDAKFKEYNDVYVRAQTQIIKDPSAMIPEKEPVWVTSRQYEDFLTTADAAAEVTIPEEQFKTCMFHEPELAQALGLSEYYQGRVSRDAFEKYFGEITVKCNVGVQLKFKNVYVPPACNFVLKNKAGYEVTFDLQYSDGNVRGRVAHNGSYTVTRRGDVGIRAWLRDARNRYGWRSYSLSDCNSYQFEVRNRAGGLYKAP